MLDLYNVRLAIELTIVQPTVVMAVKVAHDMNVFKLLAHSTKPVSLDELAKAKPADPLLVGLYQGTFPCHSASIDSCRTHYATPGRQRLR